MCVCVQEVVFSVREHGVKVKEDCAKELCILFLCILGSLTLFNTYVFKQILFSVKKEMDFYFFVQCFFLCCLDALNFPH